MGGDQADFESTCKGYNLSFKNPNEVILEAKLYFFEYKIQPYNL